MNIQTITIDKAHTALERELGQGLVARYREGTLFELRGWAPACTVSFRYLQYVCLGMVRGGAPCTPDWGPLKGPKGVEPSGATAEYNHLWRTCHGSKDSK